MHMAGTVASPNFARSPFSIDETRRYHNFAPFVRQTGERKAQTCAKAI